MHVGVRRALMAGRSLTRANHLEVPARFRGVKVAMFRDLGLPWDPEVKATVQSQAKVFESLGCIVEEAEPDLSEADACFDVLRGFLLAQEEHTREERRSRAKIARGFMLCLMVSGLLRGVETFASQSAWNNVTFAGEEIRQPEIRWLPASGGE